MLTHAAVLNPAAANDNLLAEIADMRDGTAKGTDTELQERKQYFES